MNKCIKYVSILIILMAFAATAMAADTEYPAINSVELDNYTANPGDTIAVTVNATDDVGVIDVSANGESLSQIGGGDIWEGTILAEAVVGDHHVNVAAEDSAGNVTWHNSTTYNAADTIVPAINSVELDNYTPNPGGTIAVTVNATDDVGVIDVSANGESLSQVGGGDVWRGDITAETVVGMYHVNVSASDAATNVGWDNSTSYTSTTTSSGGLPNVTDHTPDNDETDVPISEHITVTFSEAMNESLTEDAFSIDPDVEGSFKWDGNTMTFTPDDGLDYETTYEVTIGTGAVNLEGNNLDDPFSWSFTTEALGHSTGFRIWDANRDPPMDLNYTWDARSFTGFYYDLDDDTSTETLTVQLDGYDDRTIDEDDLKYITTAADIGFEYGEWGKYKVIGFMAEKYFAGYEKDKTDITTEDISLISKDMLSKVLIDEDEKHMISTGASLQLEEDYELRVVQLDVDGNQAQVELLKNGKSVDTDIVTSPDNYIYEKDLGKLDDVPLVAVRITSVFAGTESDMLVIEGIFQVSDDTIPIDTGDEYDEMEIKSSLRYTIEMRNMDDIDLEADETVDIMGNLKFIVADNDTTLRFALYEDITSEPGTHDIRGTVYNTTEKPTWDHMNFEGFYYDIDDDLGTEELRVESSGNTIDEDNLIYTTTPNLVRFELSEWGSYEVIGFMAEPYFAGYDKDETDDEITNDDISLISKDMLSKVLIDVDDKRMISTGASLQLEEGYELRVIQLDVDGNQAQVELLKNGKSVDTDIVRSPDTYVYEKDLGKLDDVPIVAISISSVFAGTESDMLVIEGAFQISDDPISVDTGDEYGEMEITSATSSKIEMKNRENVIDLDGDETIMITDNIGFKVSEDEERYYLFVRRTIGSIAALKIELPENLIVGEEIVITITADGDPVEGVQVQFAGENLGLTDSDGKVTVRSEEAGTFTIIASKENYGSASVDIRILTEAEAEKEPLKIEMPDTAEPEEDVVIKVMYEGDAIDNASVSWDGDYIGDTDETGSLTYTAEDEGTYTVTASKDGYLEGKEEIEVAYPSAEFELTDLTFPENVSVNKEFTVSVDVTNTGDADGTYLAELKVNDSVVDSQNVTLDAGDTENIEFTTKIAEAGTITIGIGTESGEITVTKAKSNTTLIAIVLIVLALLGAIGYLLISSAPEGGWTVGRLSDAIKDKFQRGGTEL